MEQQNSDLTKPNTVTAAAVGTAVAPAPAAAPEPGPEPKPEQTGRHVRITFERQLYQMRDIIALSLKDATLMQYAADYGYSAEKIRQGEILFNETDKLYETQKSALEEKKAATLILQEKKEIADATVKRFVDVARLAFSTDRITSGALGLTGTRKRAHGDWIAQNKYFYNKILDMPAAIDQIAKYNVSQAELESGKLALLEASDAVTAQRNAIAEAQNATELKNKAFKKLKLWIRKYLNVMKEALEDVPQMKEKLYIITPSEF